MSDDGGLDLHRRGLDGMYGQRRGRTWGRSDGLRRWRSRGGGCGQNTRERQSRVLD